MDEGICSQRYFAYVASKGTDLMDNRIHPQRYFEYMVSGGRIERIGRTKRNGIYTENTEISLQVALCNMDVFDDKMDDDEVRDFNSRLKKLHGKFRSKDIGYGVITTPEGFKAALDSAYDTKGSLRKMERMEKQMERYLPSICFLSESQKQMEKISAEVQRQLDSLSRFSE